MRVELPEWVETGSWPHGRIGLASMRMKRLAISIAVLAATSGSAAAGDLSKPVCFDAQVLARIIKQTPTAFPDCGKDCIVMSWPWIDEFDVERVIRGSAPTGRLQVLVVQHTRYRDDLGSRRWWLRRNDLGGFNLLRLSEDERPNQCSKTAPPARAHIHPSSGRTLDDLEKEAESVG